MGLARWFFNDWFTAYELDQVDDRFDHALASSEARHRSHEEEIDELRADVARLALLARSLAEVCVDKGALTREELKRKMLDLDLSDGRADGGLDPRTAIGGTPPRNP
jgi:hypothetical protein